MKGSFLVTSFIPGVSLACIYEYVQLDWVSNTSSGLGINLHYDFLLQICILGFNVSIPYRPLYTCLYRVLPYRPLYTCLYRVLPYRPLYTCLYRVLPYLIPTYTCLYRVLPYLIPTVQMAGTIKLSSEIIPFYRLDMHSCNQLFHSVAQSIGNHYLCME